MAGVPCIRGLRMPVATVVGMAADGMTDDEILTDFPYVEAEDIQAALRYAAEAVVSCHEHGTTLRQVLPDGWDHRVASRGTTSRGWGRLKCSLRRR
ncbi:DUF433 domain-containing protein, partial [Euzebya sp.]|uniref:DUF433 domain-containing protein n=1 Tax=Euzebya sp. TaxID=1971409 RepID=UPI0035167ED5